MTVAEDIHRMTVDEYMHIVRDLGWESTELIEGVVYDMAPEYNRHMSTVMRVFRQLDAELPNDVTCNAGSVRVSPVSLFEPDIFVLFADANLDPDDVVPVATVRLAVEVSVTTHARDRGAKLIAYAKAGVPEVWLIDPRPEVGELVRHRDPEGTSYREIERFIVGEDAEQIDVGVILSP